MLLAMCPHLDAHLRGQLQSALQHILDQGPGPARGAGSQGPTEQEQQLKVQEGRGWETGWGGGQSIPGWLICLHVVSDTSIHFHPVSKLPSGWLLQ